MQGKFDLDPLVIFGNCLKLVNLCQKTFTYLIYENEYPGTLTVFFFTIKKEKNIFHNKQEKNILQIPVD